MFLAKKVLLTLLPICLLTLAGCAQPFSEIMHYPDTSDIDNQITDDSHFSQKLQTLVNQQFKTAKVKTISDHYNVLIVGQVANQTDQQQIVSLIKSQPITKQVWDYTTISAKPVLNLNSKINAIAVDRVSTQYNISEDILQVVTVDNIIYVMGEISIAHKKDLNKLMTGLYSIDGVNGVTSLVQYAKYMTP